jgi:hypothetical protein
VFGRVPKLPAELRPALERDERVLAWARAAPGAVVVTNRGLWLPGAVRLGWHEIHKAAWADGTLTVTAAAFADGDDYSIAADVTPVSVTLATPGAVPRRVRERVTASVAYSSVYPLPGGGSARVVARRVSGRDGLSWSVRFEGAAVQNRDDPAVRAAVDQFVTSAKSSIAAPD